MNLNHRYEPCQIKLELERLKWTSQLRRQASIEEAREIDWNEQRDIRERLDRITRAQRRIDNGLYGTCLKCHCPIDLERLIILPTTEYCQVCSAQMASRGNSRLRRAA